MGKYYDIKKPFSIDNWNELIRDVNDILENPPGGSECPPVEPIDEVEDPHIWAVEDVEEVRDALIETCPEIKFDKDLEIWKSEIIDEIEEQMELAWCNCEDLGPIEYEGPKVTGEFVNTAPSETYSDGATYESGYAYICQSRPYQIRTYNCPWHDVAGKEREADTISMAANTLGCAAYWASLEYASTWADLQKLAHKIEFYQRITNKYTTLTDGAIDDYEECMDLAETDEERAACEPLKTPICTYGKRAKEYQEKVDEQVSNYAATHPSLATSKETSDTKAQACMALLLTMQPGLPGDVNLTSELIDFFSDGQYAWDKLVLPTEGGDRPVSIMFSSPGTNKVIPLASAGRRLVPTGYSGTAGYYYQVMPNSGYDTALSPGGYPFVCGRYGSLLLTSVMHTYSNAPVKTFCDNHGSNTCIAWNGDEVGACAWGPEQPMYCVGGICLGDDDFNDYKDAAYIQDSWLKCYMLTSPRQGKDYTEEQETFNNLYLDWYTENPEYDDRHEDFC